MKLYSFEGKNLDDLKEKVLNELDKEENELFIAVTEEESGLFKTKKYHLDVLKKEDVVEEIKHLLHEIIGAMGIEVNIEVKKRENYLGFNLLSNNNAILIGKDGKTLDAIQLLIKSSISNRTGFTPSIVIDVEGYKEKQHKRLENLAYKLAKEVLRTGIEVKMDSMNSYERRLVHEIISKIDGVHTISEGEEPNRYVVIKKED